MLVFAVLRHADYRQPADVPSAWLPWPLTARGVEQAKAAASAIENFLATHSLRCISTIDSSLMLRAWQTASIIAEQLQAEPGVEFSVIEHAALAERGVGAAANLSVARIEQILEDDPRYGPPPPGWKSRSDYRLPFQGAESLEEAGIRVARHLEAAWKKHSSRGDTGLKVIVGHGASIRHAAKALGMLEPDLVGAVSMYHAEPLFISRDSGKWKIIGGNWKPRSSAGDAGDEFSTG